MPCRTCPADRTRTVRSELSALTSLQVWLTLGVGAVGFGGMFAMYSYIAPTVTEVTGLPASAVPVFLLVFGASGFVGNLVAGRMGDWSVIRSVVIGMAGLGVSLALFAVAAPYAVPALVVLALVSVLASVLVINLQLRLMQVAGTAQTLAAASNHAALNLANALGAWVGGARHRRRVRLHRPVRRRGRASPRSAWASSASRSSSTAATTRTVRPCARSGRSRWRADAEVVAPGP